MSGHDFDPNLCAVCLEDISNEDAICSLKCCHSFHTSCIFQCSQYDTRCPVCRTSIDGLRTNNTTSRVSQAPIVEIHFTPSENTNYDAHRRSVRNYDARVNRRLRIDENLRDKKNKLRAARQNLDSVNQSLDRAWKVVERQAWDSDAMRDLRMEVTRAKRKFRNTEKSYNDSILSIFGDRPALPQAEEGASLQHIIEATLLNLRVDR